MNKKELKVVADSVFERYPRIDKVFVSSDGQAFFEEAHAKNHATAKDLEVETFRRPDETETDFDIEDMDRVQLEAFIKENKLEVVFYAETPDEDLRTMVVNAIEVDSKPKKTTKKGKK